MSIPLSANPLEGALRACSRSVCSHIKLHPRRTIQKSAFSTTSPAAQEIQRDTRDLPRWRQTPKGMAMPFRLRPEPKQPVFTVNDEEEVLNQTYNRLLGKGGDSMLPEDVKWLAVTHKSFDHGRQGVNDRLAFLGKRIVDLQCSLALLNTPEVHARDPAAPAHPALKGLENVTSFSKQRTLDKRRLAQLAQDYGLAKVMRWKPRKADNLKSSGIEVVLVHTMYSIIGAIALQRGGEAANKTVREKILNRLGL